MTQRNWSVPETEVVQRIHDRLDGDGTDALATIVDVEGNAYRRPGAKMLLDEDGAGVGSITAGCLEDELVTVGAEVRETGRPQLVTYDLMEDDEADVWGLGVGCNGVIEVLVEPLTDTYRSAVEAFADGRDVGIATVLDGGDSAFEQGDRAYYHPAADELRTPEGAPAADWPAGIAGPAGELAADGTAGTISVEVDGTELTVFVDGLSAPSELVVFGTGHDVGPVTEFAAKNDFRVTVVGFRGAVDLESRFPAADRIVTTAPAAVGEELSLDQDTYAVVMTHNFVDDQLTVEALLDAGIPYVGLMGPRERFEQLRDGFDEGFDDDALASLYTPVGLDLGGGSPYQIAHSIVGEVLAVSNGRDPRHLREREGPIHERVDVESDAPVQ
ncbi:XdhC family protein [Halobellus clavatus]|uniref:Xanthine and CO dehydrogenase maturation factor, XdhC/CoxF family n=1 Tax=Halobellus clavatus TaxID=660517 RepID=A0A1H3HS97_9EURY|nr:XdhC/CoxI family protein [Halobellus clavatus]SDY18312.1 Xanthine and CO dehydrogenase maturation factor, XdhC/CoxF family [Halobellus clavatus]